MHKIIQICPMIHYSTLKPLQILLEYLLAPRILVLDYVAYSSVCLTNYT